MLTRKPPLVALALLVGAVSLAGGCKNKKEKNDQVNGPDGEAQAAQPGDPGGENKPRLAAMSVDGTRCVIDGKQKDFQDLQGNMYRDRYL